MATTYDLIVLGGGTTGIAGAVKAAELGKSVLLVEQAMVGGVCVNHGCVPSKTMIHAARPWRNGTPITGGEASPDYCKILALREKAVADVRRRQCEEELAKFPTIERIKGRGVLLSPGCIKIGDEQYQADHILIATGGKPRRVAIPGSDMVNPLTSYSILQLTQIPESLIILGGGVIAVEMGQMFQRLGTQVTILERGTTILREFDARLTAIYRLVLESEGVMVETSIDTRIIEPREGGLILHADRAGQEVDFSAEHLLLALGTVPLTEGIGLDDVGVERGAGGFIVVDKRLRTTTAGIWAAGDVIGQPLMATPGAAEAELAVIDMFSENGARDLDHSATPMAVFIDPELAMVGQFSEPDETIDEVCLNLESVAKAHVMGGSQGMILIQFDKKIGTILGVQILAVRAADMIHEATLLIKAGMTIYDLAETIHTYPTLSDGLRVAARQGIYQLNRTIPSVTPQPLINPAT